MNWDALLVLIIMLVGLLAGGAGAARALRLAYWGVGAAVSFGLWLVLGLAYAMPFGWHAWVGDLALLATALALAVAAWWRRGVPHPQPVYQHFDVALLATAALVLAVPALVLPVPLDTDAQGFGYLALTARLGGDLTNLAPLNPTINYLYAPGFTVSTAYLSERLGTPLHTTQLGLAAALAAWLLLVIYDLSALFGGQVRGRAGVMASFVGVGLLTAYMDSHYTSVIGLAFGGAFLAAAYTVVVPGSGLAREGTGTLPYNVGLGALFLAALVLVHPDTTIIIGLGFGAWLLLAPLGTPRPTLRGWLLAALGIPALALVLLAPWLWSVHDLLGGEIASPFSRDPAYWRVALSVPPETLYHGGLVGILALAGAFVGLRGRSHAALLATGWLVLIVEFAAFGLLERVVPWLVAPVVRYDYPFSIAWHGPIIPYALLGGAALVWGWQRFGPGRAYRLGYTLVTLAALAAVLGGVFNREIIDLSKGRVTFFGAFSSAADVAAMTWLRENTVPEAYILNFPGPQEGDWVPVIAERRSVYYRPQPFFDVPGDPLLETDQQQTLRAFWEDPANPAHAARLRAAGVDYVIVPQVWANPASFAGHIRWRRPFTDLITPQSTLDDARYLEPVFEANGAAVYRVTEG